MCCEKKEINANVCFNKKNGDAVRYEYFDQLLYNDRYKVERKTHGWIIINLYSTDSTPQQPAG